MQTLRLFCDVALCRSFSQAAARHGITQSAASQRISALERRLGVTLIDRSVRPLRPTPAGDLYLHECRQLIERYDTLEHRIQQMPVEPAGEIVVDAIYSAGIDLLKHVREAVEKRWPRVKVTLDYKPPEEVYDAVREQRCDVGIVSYPQRWREVGMVPLWREPMAVVTSPKHALAGRGKIQASDLGRWQMATFEPTLPVGRAIRRYLREHGVKPNVQNVFDNIDTIKAAVAVTDEIAILPRRTVRREVEAGTLALIELEPALSRPMGLIYRDRSRGRSKTNGHDTQAFSPAVRVFVDALINYQGPDIAPPGADEADDDDAPARMRETRQLVGDHA